MMQGLKGHYKEYEPYSKHNGKFLDSVERGVTWSDIYSKKQLYQCYGEWIEGQYKDPAGLGPSK